MKLLVLSNLYPPDAIGGYERGCLHACEALRERGHEVLVLTTRAASLDGDHPGYVRRELEIAPIYQAHRPHLHAAVERRLAAQGAFVNVPNVEALLHTLAVFEPDAAYLWNLKGIGGLALVLALQHAGVPWVWHLMDDVPSGLAQLEDGLLLRSLGRQLSRELDGRFLSCSTRVVEEIEANGVDLRDRVEIVPNWVRGTPPPERSAFYDGGHLRLVCAGQLGHHKGTDIVVDVARRLRDLDHVDFAIDLFGSGSDEPLFRGSARAEGVDGWLRFRGELPQEELVTRYGEYDVFLFPTWRREPFAFAPLEAAAGGCVPLMSWDCGNAEWMIDGVDCLKADRTAEAFAARLVDVLEGRQRLDEIGRRAQASVLRHFHLDRILPRIEQALAGAAQERRRPRGTPEAFHGLARLAEGLVGAMVDESFEYRLTEE